jgi:hypothetical protein
VNKKVGIITLYYQSDNFGACLQAYALQKVIEGMGVRCEQICYDSAKKIPERQERQYGDLFKPLKTKVRTLLTSRRNAFDKFQQMIPHSGNIYSTETIHNCVSEYDAFVCGSDQIWNDWSGWLEDEAPGCYTLNFVPDDKIKISYAASIGGTTLGKAHMEKLRPGLQKLNFVSVRECSAVPLIRELSGKEAVPVLDPTLLLAAGEWDELKTGLAVPNEPYAVCYLLGLSKKQRIAAAEFTHQNHCRAMTFPYIYGAHFHKEDVRFGDIRDLSSGPAEFVKLIKNAEFVITDSFHAIVFSMIYHKPFYVFEREMVVGTGTMNSRIWDFLEEYGLQSRLVTPESLLKKNKVELIGYAYADSVLERRKQESLDYLKMALATEMQEKGNGQTLYS